MARDETIEWVLEREGGDTFTDLETDAGGPTKFGITQPFLTEVREAAPELELPEHPRDLTPDQAKACYNWLMDRIQYDEMPRAVGTVVFDGAVNHGRGTMVRMLQRRVGTVTDGVVGPITLGAVRVRVDLDPFRERGLAEDLIWARLNLYAVLGRTRRQTGLPNLPGWISRMQLLRQRVIAP
jgi:lysozyme family protein